MPQHYSSTRRENSEHGLPDIETFRMRYAYCPDCGSLAQDEDGAGLVACSECVTRIPVTSESWFYWFCLPGCLPDSAEPMGPFDTEDEALTDARDGNEDEDDDSDSDA